MFDFYDSCVEALYNTSFTSISLGLEKGIGAKDAPFVRVLPIKSRQNGNNIDLTFQVIYGYDKKNKELEDMYIEFFDGEEQIKKALKNIAIWQETETDKDEVPNLKVAVMTFKASICP